MKEIVMEFELRGYELCLTVRRARVKSKPENQKSVGQLVAPSGRAERRHLFASGCRDLLLTR